MHIIPAIIYLVIVAISAAYIYYKNAFKFWKKRGFVHTEPVVPWGDAKGVSFARSLSEIITDIYYQFPMERVVGIFLMNKPKLIVRDPELVKSIFVRDFMSFHDRGFHVNEQRDPLSGHLFTLGGSKWRNLRVKLSPTFTSGKIKMMFPIMTECSKQFSKALEIPAKEGQVIEVKDYAARFTTDIISSAAFGLETNSLLNPESEFRKFGQEIFSSNFRKAIKSLTISFFPFIADVLSLKRISPKTEEFFMNSLRQTIAYRKENQVKRNDFLDLLIQLMTKGYVEGADDGRKDAKTTNTKFSFEEAAAQSFVFFIAGFETSSTTMQFALYELARHPDIQQKVREEIRATLDKYNDEITYECVMEMHYLSGVIDETLRLYPPLAFLQRECNTDYAIADSDLVIPKGVTVFIPVMGMHRDPEYYPEPEKFDPDRFLEETKPQRHNYTYLPFGEGPRNCIGMRFGLLQTKVGLITLLNKYEFSISSETTIPIVYDPKAFVLSPLGGMYLKVTEYTN